MHEFYDSQMPDIETDPEMRKLQHELTVFDSKLRRQEQFAASRKIRTTVIADSATLAVEVLSWKKPKANWLRVSADICIKTSEVAHTAIRNEPFQEFKHKREFEIEDVATTNKVLFDGLVYFQRLYIQSFSTPAELK